MKADGSCHCNFISYAAEIDPDRVRICHCDDCQKLSGSAFRIVVSVDEQDFTLLSGQPKTYIKIAESGNQRAQVFCPECGTHIYATSVGEGVKRFGVRVSTLSQKNDLVPKRQFWCKSAQSWVTKLDGMDSTETQ